METIEYGVFNSEGCIENGIYSQNQAEDKAEEYRSAGDHDAYAFPVCPDHDEQPCGSCEECDAEVDDDL